MTEEEKLKHWKRRHNHIAKDLRTPKYRQRVVQDSKQEKEYRRMMADIRKGIYIDDAE